MPHNDISDDVGLCGGPAGVPEWWSTLQRSYQEGTIGKTLRQTMERLVDVSRAKGRQGILRVRKTLGRVFNIINGQEDQTAAAPPRVTVTPSVIRQNSAPQHQPLHVIPGPINYLEKCRHDQASAAGSPLHASSVIQSKNQHGTEVCEGERGDQGKRGVELTENDEKLRFNRLSGLTIPKAPLSAKELDHYLMHAIHSSKLDNQLKNIPLEDLTRSKDVASRPCNKKKNRYKNNIPYDDSRVVLEGRGDADYINASYISSPFGKRRFIAAQGPKGSNERTVEDFWLMIWQNNTNVIIMVANLIEGGREKVSMYWPDTFEKTEDYGLVKVKMLSSKEHLDFTVRHFLISMNTQSRQVVQYQYTAWPDHYVPSNAVGAALMVRSLSKWRWTGPPVLHCSAGLGRSGTILLVLVLLDDLLKNGLFHPPDSLHKLRMCRANLLDNQLQYRFTHQVLLEVLFGHKTNVNSLKLSDDNFVFSRNMYLQEQFQELNRFPVCLTYDWAKANNPYFNRDNTVLPADGRQVPLRMPEDHDDGQQIYVNAVHVRGYSLQETFLVTEHPMIHTISRAWKLAYMTKASAWVFLHDHCNVTDMKQDFPSVIPPGGFGELEGITVRVDGEVDKRFYTETSIALLADVPHAINVIQLKNWHPSKEVPDDVKPLISLMLRLEELRRAAPYNIMMVSCSDGYSASGMFVTLERLVAQANLTQCVNVFRNVLSVRFDRPQFIKSKRQYLYLHEAVISYHQMILKERKRKQIEAERRDASNAKSEVPSVHGLNVQTMKNLASNERQKYDNKEERKEQKQKACHMPRGHVPEINDKEKEMMHVKEKEERKQKNIPTESNLREKENERKSRNFAGRGQIKVRESKMGKGKIVDASEEESHYECIWGRESQMKGDIYDHVWKAREGHPGSDKE